MTKESEIHLGAMITTVKFTQEFVKRRKVEEVNYKTRHRRAGVYTASTHGAQHERNY